MQAKLGFFLQVTFYSRLISTTDVISGSPLWPIVSAGVPFFILFFLDRF